jgi:NADH-quinone oxidoreductase subunit H
MPIDLTLIARALIFPGFIFLLAIALFFDWFERKVAARMQNRMGPTYTGPLGILQPVADYIKLLTKEDVMPRQVNKLLFTLTPVLAFSLFSFTMFLIPIDGSNVILNSSFEGDLILVIALMIILALGPAFLAKSLSFVTIAAKQTIPFALLIPWCFVLFIITLQAELEKDPFDIPHAETEIVGGYETEFSGRKLAFIKLSEDFQFLIGAALVTELFLGGPLGPVLFGPKEIWYAFWFVAKTLVVIFILEYIGNVSARLRIDQVVHANWRMLIPLALLSLALTVICEPLLRSIVG